MPATIKGMILGTGNRIAHVILKNPLNNYITTMTRGNSYAFYDISIPGRYKIYESKVSESNIRVPNLLEKVEIGFIDVTQNQINNNELIVIKKQLQTLTQTQLSTIVNDANLSWKYNGVDYSDISNQVQTNVTLPPLVELNKSVDLTDAVPGDVLTYTINVNNPALVDATSVVLLDTVPEGTSFVVDSFSVDGVTIPGVSPQPPGGANIGTLMASTDYEVKFQVVVNEAPIPDQIVNDSTIIFEYDGISLSNNSNQIVTNATVPSSLNIVKSVDKVDAQVGDTLEYTLKITNPTTIEATDLVIVDSIADGVTFENDSVSIDGVNQPGISPLPPTGISITSIVGGGSVEVSFKSKITSLTDSVIENDANVSWKYKGVDYDDTSNVVQTNVSLPITSMSLTKSSDLASAMPGDIITYTIDIKNDALIEATNMVLFDTIPEGTSFIQDSVFLDGTPKPGVNPAPPIGFNIGTVNAESSSQVTFKVSVNEAPIPNQIVNDSTITFEYASNPLSNNSNQIITDATVPRALNVVKSADKLDAQVGDTITYTIEITNPESIDATDVYLIDTLPVEAEFIADSLSVDGAAKPGESPLPPTGFSVGTIAAGSSVLISFQSKIIALGSNLIENSADVVWKYKGVSYDAASNVIQTNVTLPTSSMSVTKSADLTSVVPGDAITYTIDITNEALIDATNIVLYDTIPEGTSFIQDSLFIDAVPKPGANPSPPTGFNIGTVNAQASSQVTFKVMVNEAPIPNQIVNDSTITFEYASNPLSNNSNQIIADATVPRQLNAVKSVDKSDVKLGDIITYTLKITNPESIDATNVYLIDTLPIEAEFVVDSLSVDGVAKPGESPLPPTGFSVGTIAAGSSVSVSFQSKVIALGSNVIENSADVAWQYKGVSYDIVSNAVQTNVSLPELIGIAKSVDNTNVVPGDIVTYTIDLTNPSLLDATNVVFKDTIPEGTSFVADSVYLDGAQVAGANPSPPTGFSVGTISAESSSQVTFKVVVNEGPIPNQIKNDSTVTFEYASNPLSNNSNQIVSDATIPDVLTITKSVDKTDALIGDVLTYTVDVLNPTTIDATDITITDAFSDAVEFVPDSFTVNGAVLPGANPMPPGVNIGTVAAGSNAKIQFQAKIVSAGTGEIKNNVVVNWQYNGVDYDTTSNEESTTIETVDISELSKTVDKTEATIGDILTYTITIPNKGTVSLDNVTVIDTLPEGMVFIDNSLKLNGTVVAGASPLPPLGANVGTAPAGQTTEITFQVKIDFVPTPSNTRNAVSVLYDYTVGGQTIPGGSGTESTDTTDVVSGGFSDGGFIKSVDKDIATVGDILTYSFVLTNTGNISIDNVILTDTMPLGTSFVGGSVLVNGVSVPGGNPQNGVSIGTIASLQTVQVSFNAKVDIVPDPNIIKNSGFVAYEYTVAGNVIPGSSNSNEISTEIDFVDFDNEDNFKKSVDVAYADIGDIITYTIDIKNTGNVAAQNAQIVDTVPEGTSFVVDSVSVDSAIIQGVVPSSIPLGNINPGQTIKIQFKVKVDELPSVNPIVNTAALNYSFKLGSVVEDKVNISNGASTLINTANMNPEDGGFVKSVNKEFADVGDELIYTISIKNTGNVDSLNVMLMDTIPENTSFVADSVTIDGIGKPGANPENGIALGTITPNQVINVKFKVTVLNIPNPNTITNMAKMSFEYNVDPSKPNKTGETYSNGSVTTIESGGISPEDGGFVKSVDKANADIGDELTYTINITNTGNVSVENVVLTDTMPTGTSFKANSVTIDGVVQPGASPQDGIPIGTIASAQNVVVEFVAVIDAEPIPTNIVNVSEISYSYLVGTDVKTATNQSNQIETLVENANISPEDGGFVKTLDKKYATVGDIVTYTIDVKNTGNVPAQNVKIVDTLPNELIFIPGSVSINGVSSPSSNPATGITVGNLNPDQSSQIIFTAQVNKAPAQNPIVNIANASYSYTSGSEVKTISGNSNGSDLTINSASFNPEDGGFVKSVDKAYADISEEIEYTLTIKNTGNIPVDNVVITDVIPSGTEFVNSSVVVDGESRPSENPIVGINIGTVDVDKTVIISFKVVITEQPASSTIINNAQMAYDFVVDPELGTIVSASAMSNDIKTQINSVIMNAEKSADKQYATLDDEIVYTINISNDGNVVANQVIFIDSIPMGTEFIDGSFSVDGSVKSGANPASGVNIGSLNVGQIMKVKFSVKVTDPNVGNVVNKSQVDFQYKVNPTGPFVSETIYSNETTSQIDYANISPEDGGFVKSADKQQADIGDVITFTLNVKNTGNVLAKDIMLMDTIPNETEFVEGSVSINGIAQSELNPQDGISIGDLNPNQSSVVKFKVKVLSILANPIKNTATMEYSYNVGPDTTKTNTNESTGVEIQVESGGISPEDGGFVKSADKESAGISDIITYTISLTNTGNVPVNNAIFADTIPAGTELVANSVTVDSVVYPNTNPQNGIPLGTLNPSDNKVIEFKVKVLEGAPDTVGNVGRVNYSYTVGSNVKNQTNETNKVDISIEDANISPEDGGFVKTVDKEYATVGDELIYNISIKNTGNVLAQNVVISDTIPLGTEFVEGSVSISGVSNPILNPANGVAIGNVMPDETVTVSFKVVVIEVPEGGVISNQASSSYEFKIGSNTISESTLSESIQTTINDASFNGGTSGESGITKEADKKNADIGDEINYTITLKNLGNVNADNAILTDSITDLVTFVDDSVTVNGSSKPGISPMSGISLGTIEPNQSVVVKFTVVVNQNPTTDIILNSANLDYTYTIDPINGRYKDVVIESNVIQTNIKYANIGEGSLVKSANTEYAALGDIIEYTIDFENTGNVAATNTIFTDSMPNGTEFVENSVSINGVNKPGANPQNGVNIGVVNPGDKLQIIFSVKVVGSVSSVTNVGSMNYKYVINQGEDPKDATNTTNGITTNVNYADISAEGGGLVKTSDKEAVDIGDVITYTINIKNTGNVDAFDVFVYDTIPKGTEFVENSLSIDGVNKPGVNPQNGVEIGTLEGGESVVVKFKVKVVKFVDTIQNMCRMVYSFDIGNGEIRTDSTESIGAENDIETANIGVDDGGFIKTVDKDYAGLSDVLTYTLSLENTGNVLAQNTIIKDVIPSATEFVSGSVVVNGIAQPNSNPSLGIIIGTISPGEAINVSFKVKVISLPNPNPMQNAASISYDYSVGGNTKSKSGNSNAAETFVNVGVISPEDGGFIKSVDKAYAKIDDILTYKVNVKNTGNVIAQNMVFTDKIPYGTEYIQNSLYINGVIIAGKSPEDGIPISNLAPGASIEIVFKVKIISLPQPNPIENFATMSYEYIGNPNDPPKSVSGNSNIVTTQVNEAIISAESGGFTKTVDKKYSFVGDTLTYTITLKNIGNVDAISTTLTDSMPEGTVFVPGSVFVDGRNKLNADPVLGVDVGTISPGQSVVVSFKVDVVSVASQNPVTNQAQINYLFMVDPSGGFESQTDISNEISTYVDTAIISNEDGGFVKSVDKEFAGFNEILTYTVDITNTGNIDADNVVFMDTIPIATSFVKDSVTINGAVVEDSDPSDGIALGTISPKETVRITFKVTVTDIPDSTEVANTALIEYSYVYGSYGSNTVINESNTIVTNVDGAIIDVEGGGLKKSSDKDIVTLGDEIEYTIILKNTGNIPATDIVFVDTIAQGLEFIPASVTVNGATRPGEQPDTGITIDTLEPDDTVIITFKVLVDKIPNPNPVENIGNLSYNYCLANGMCYHESVNTNSVSNEVRIAIISNEDGGLIKSVDKSLAKVSDVLTYTITIKNTGNVTAENVVLTDVIPEGLELVPSSVSINGEIQSGSNPSKGISIGDVMPKELVIVKFKVKVIEIPSQNPASNIANVKYEYSLDETTTTPITASNDSNTVSTKIENATLEVKKSSNASCTINPRNVVSYKIEITNTGNATAKNVNVVDMLPNEVTFVTGSVLINGEPAPNVDPNNGITMANIAPGETVDIVFDVVANDVQEITFVSNMATVNYESNGEKVTSSSNELVYSLMPACFSQFMLNDCFKIPPQKPDMGDIIGVAANVSIVDYHKVNTIQGTSVSSQRLSGVKIMVRGIITYIAEYSSYDCEGTVHSVHFNKPFTTYIVAPTNIDEICNIDFEDKVEDVEAILMDCRTLKVDTTLFINIMVQR